MSKKRKDDHITLGNGGRMQCDHCGDSYTPNYPVAIEIIVGMTKAFAKSHRDCKPPKEQRCAICLKVGHAFHQCVDLNVRTPQDWMALGDTGISSIAIWRHMQGKAPDTTWGPSPPADPADFGRCYRLLKKFPEWRARIGDMAAYEGWWALVEKWDELEALYAEEATGDAAPRLWKMMQELEAR